MTQPATKSNDWSRGIEQPVAGRYTNTILNAMDTEIIGRLRLRPVTFELGHEMEWLP
jgi:hypothetical protein